MHQINHTQSHQNAAMTQRDDVSNNGETRMLCSSSTVSETTALPSHKCCKRMSLDSRMPLGADGAANLTYGLLITLDDNTCRLSFCPDQHYPEIHPNAYAPAALTRMRKLGGGGSGVAVFEGHHPELGDIVMKHGGDKDLKELFALATIGEELAARGHRNPAAAQHLQERIPAFRMIYISPNHLGEKRRELWHRLAHLYKYSSRNLLLLTKEDELQESIGDKELGLDPVTEEEEDEKKEATTATTIQEELPLKPKPRATGQLMKTKEDELHESRELGLDPVTEEEEEKKETITTTIQEELPLKPNPRATGQLMRTFPKVPSRNKLVMTKSGTVSGHRDIAIYSEGNSNNENTTKHKKKSCSVELLGDSLTITIPYTSQQTDDSGITPIDIPGNGYHALQAIVRDLNTLMQDHKWKLTLGQKRIGGANPKTGNLWLYAGKLEQKLLNNLISQKIQLVRDLATLTTVEEQDAAVVMRIQKDVARFEEEDITVADISNETDCFVANSIKKNFLMEVGRIPVLSRLGRQFRELNMQNSHSSLKKISSEGSVSEMLPRPVLNENESLLILSPEEEIPAHHLGSLTRAGALMGDTFENVPFDLTALEMHPFIWRNILRNAIQPRRQQLMNRTSTMALARIWTCGLTDAGVHNLFLNEESVWLFDLGSPQLYSAPGFLTKFLFSFFHTLGMEEAPGDSDTWVRRFEHNPITGKLRLTPETKILLRQAYSAFETTLDRLIVELFDSDNSLRWLLIQYVTLQLISDASFCLQRWTIKGGGRTRDANHQKGIEKWLWRALWDLYIAFDINTSETWTRLDVRHPSHRDSVCYADMKDLVYDAETRLTLQALDEKESDDETEDAA